MSRFYKDPDSKHIFQELVSLADHDEAGHLEELTANTTDAAQEKHVPVVHVDGNRVEVTVGSFVHPMQEDHYITGIYIETRFGSQYRKLTPSDEPKAVFFLADGDQFIAAYEYCTLHGLWKKEA